MILLALDTEDNSKGRVTLVNFYDGEKNYTFTKLSKAIDWLAQYAQDQKTSVQIWACNLGYDINNLFKGRYEYLEISYANSRVISADIPNCGIQFLDTLNHWHLSVEEMGKRIGLKKITDLDVDNMELMTKRCHRDTEIVWHFVDSMRKTYDKIGCRLKKTIASTSLDFFQREFYGGRVHSTLTRKQIDFLHTGYYGGRTEVFFNKPVEGTIFYHDINSLYPSCQLNDYPNLFEHYDLSNPLSANLSLEGALEVKIKSPKDLPIPYLPLKHDQKLIFPLGEFTGTYTYFELREALKLGYKIQKINKGIEFCKTVRPFDDFVNTVYKARLKSMDDWLMQTSYKNILNHGYGKYGQKNEYTSFVPIDKIDSIRMGGDEGAKIQVYGNLALVKKKGPYPKHANCIWAMYTTAYARHREYQGLSRIEPSGGLLLYADTDSVIYESSKQILENSKALGEFKLEGIYKYAWFKLPKLYKLIPIEGDKIIYKSKGVPWRQSKEFFETGTVRFQRPFKLKETLRRNLSPKRKVKLETNYWEWNEKTMNDNYTKRLTSRTGHTRPLVIHA